MKSERRKLIRLAGFAGVVLIILGTLVYWFGCALEFEYPFWPTLWVAEQIKTHDGSRITDLIRIRSGNSYVQQHWHHCTWCDEVYPHAPHMAVKVTINNDEKIFYLFDWDASHMRLIPITINTAKLFPELIPTGSVAEPLGLGMNPQLYHHDEPCSIVPQSVKR